MPHDSRTVKAIFLEAIELKTAELRARFLEDACGPDADLRARVESLLASAEQPFELLDAPALETAGNTSASGGHGERLESTVEFDALEFLTPSTSPGSLGRLGHYEVMEVLGRGGMGVVLRAYDDKLERYVAIKVLAPQHSGNSSARKRFVREARAAAAIDHENVVGIHGVEDGAAAPYLVMHCVDGKTLQRKIDAGTIAAVDVARIGLQTARGLAAAHKRGLIHRDVKPANILLEGESERVKLGDFGLARSVDDVSLTSSGYIAGTPTYMSPEQARSEKTDHRTDLFSLGSVLYAMCTGMPPFRAETSMAVLKKVCEETPLPIRELNPTIPVWLENLVGQLLAKDPEKRIQTAAEVAELLANGLARQESGGRVSSQELKRLDSKHRWDQLTSAPLPANRWRLTAYVSLAAAIGIAAWALSERASGDKFVDKSLDLPPTNETREAGPKPLTALKVLQEHRGGVASVAFSPDGTRLASGGLDKEIRLWDVATWQSGKPQSGHLGEVVALAFSPAGDRLASTTPIADQYVVRLWNVSDQRSAGGVGADEHGMFALAWSSDGKTLATGGWNRGVLAWDTATWKERRRVPDATEHHLRALALSADGSRILTGGRGPVRLWNLGTGQEIPIPGALPKNINPVYLAGDIAFGWIFNEGRVAIIDVGKGKLLRSWKAHPDRIEALAVSRDARFLASCGNDSLARIWSARDGKEVAVLIGHIGTVYGAAFSPDGLMLATAGRSDSQIRIWQLPESCHTQLQAN